MELVTGPAAADEERLQGHALDLFNGRTRTTDRTRRVVSSAPIRAAASRHVCVTPFG